MLVEPTETNNSTPPQGKSSGSLSSFTTRLGLLSPFLRSRFAQLTDSRFVVSVVLCPPHKRVCDVDENINLNIYDQQFSFDLKVHFD